MSYGEHVKKFDEASKGEQLSFTGIATTPRRITTRINDHVEVVKDGDRIEITCYYDQMILSIETFNQIADWIKENS